LFKTKKPYVIVIINLWTALSAAETETAETTTETTAEATSYHADEAHEPFQPGSKAMHSHVDVLAKLVHHTDSIFSIRIVDGLFVRIRKNCIGSR
jgi:hypothetical protein